MDKMTIYEIDNAILECVDMETGEILDDERLNELNMARDKKIEGVACWIKDIEARQAARKTEISSLTAKNKSDDKLVENLEEWLRMATGEAKFVTPRVTIGWRKSDSVNIVDEAAIPEAYKRRVEEVKIDKMFIKKAIKDGFIVSGAELEEKNNIQIK